MDAKEISKFLQKIYFFQLITAVVLIGFAYILKYRFGWVNNNITPGIAVSVLITTLSGIAAIALPVFYRSYFVYKNKDKKQISSDDFLAFERLLVTIALMSPYFLIIAVLINMNETANMLIALFSIYAIYYFFPTEKKMLFEMRIFRIKPAGKKSSPKKPEQANQ